MLSKTAPLPGDGDAAPPQRKKRTVLVRKATAKAASKTVRRVVVARKPRADEDVGRLTIKNVGSPTRVKGVRYVEAVVVVLLLLLLVPLRRHCCCCYYYYDRPPCYLRRYYYRCYSYPYSYH